MSDSGRRYRAAAGLILCLVFLWGFGHRLFGTLAPQFSEVFALTGQRRSIASSIYDIAYICLPLPAAIYANQFGYRPAILLSLGCLTIGTFTFYPAAEMHAFGYYLMAVSFMAAGWVVLENATNPLILAMGRRETAVRRLCLIQSLYPLGAIAGILAGHWVQARNLVLPHAGDAVAIGHPYIVIGVVVLVLAFAFDEIPFPPVASARAAGKTEILRKFKTILASPTFRFALIAQAACIIASGIIWILSSPAYAELFPAATKPEIWDGFFATSLLFGLGRFVSAGLMFRIAPARILFAQTGLAAALALAACLSTGALRAVLILALNVPLAITWPCLIGISLEGLSRAPAREPFAAESSIKLATGLISLSGALGALVLEFVRRPPFDLADAPLLALCALCSLAMAGFSFCTARKRYKACEIAA